MKQYPWYIQGVQQKTIARHQELLACREQPKDAHAICLVSKEATELWEKSAVQIQWGLALMYRSHTTRTSPNCCTARPLALPADSLLSASKVPIHLALFRFYTCRYFVLSVPVQVGQLKSLKEKLHKRHILKTASPQTYVMGTFCGPSIHALTGCVHKYIYHISSCCRTHCQPCRFLYLTSMFVSL